MTIRDALETDLNNIAELADNNDLLIPPLDQAAFARMLSWLHASPPQGRRLEFVCDNEGKLIAHYGAVPFQYKVSDQYVVAGFAANIVIDKDARKKALFFPLQKHFANLYPALGYGFTYGVMTRAGVLKPHLAVGWKEVGDLNVYVKPVSAANIFSKLFPRLGFKKTIRLLACPFQFLFDRLTSLGATNVQIEQVKKFNPSHDDFLRHWTQSQSITAVRSSEILNWRFVEFAERNYKISIATKNGEMTGYVVTRVMPMKQFSCLAIVDLIALDADPSTIASLVKQCSHLAKEEQVDFISTVFPAHYNFKKLMIKKGFIPTKEKFTLVTRTPKDSELSLKKDIFKQWFINWFDHDFV